MIEMGLIELVFWWGAFLSLIIVALMLFAHIVVIAIGWITGKWILPGNVMENCWFTCKLFFWAFILFALMVLYIGIDLGRIVIWPY